jgi:hypothetical protein
VEPLGVGEAWSLLSPEAEARIDEARWAHQARTFFKAEIALARPKAYPAGTTPLADAAEVDVAPRGGAPTRVLLITVPLDRAPDVRAAAARAVAAIGGAGMDALLARARRLWQVRAAVPEGGDPRAPLAAAAVLASVFLSPIVPPGEAAIFGVKGARERLEARGWRT